MSDEKTLDTSPSIILCRRCGRRLKKSDAQEIGFGPICKKKMEICNQPRLFTVKKYSK